LYIFNLEDLEYKKNNKLSQLASLKYIIKRMYYPNSFISSKSYFG